MKMIAGMNIEFLRMEVVFECDQCHFGLVSLQGWIEAIPIFEPSPADPSVMLTPINYFQDWKNILFSSYVKKFSIRCKVANISPFFKRCALIVGEEVRWRSTPGLGQKSQWRKWRRSGTFGCPDISCTDLSWNRVVIIQLHRGSTSGSTGTNSNFWFQLLWFQEAKFFNCLSFLLLLLDQLLTNSQHQSATHTQPSILHCLWTWSRRVTSTFDNHQCLVWIQSMPLSLLLASLRPLSKACFCERANLINNNFIT